MQSLMQIYKEYPDLGSMLQLGYCAAYMQQYAATWMFFGKKSFLIFPNTKILLHYKKLSTTKPPFTNYMICSIFSSYAANMQQICCKTKFEKRHTVLVEFFMRKYPCIPIFTLLSNFAAINSLFPIL